MTLPHREKAGAPYRFLISVSSGIGDALMSTPALRHLRKKVPSAQLDILTSKAVDPMFESDPTVDGRWSLEACRSWRGFLRLLHALRKHRYDIYLGTIPSNTIVQALIPFLVGIPLRIKHRTPHSGFRDYDFLYHRVEPLSMARHRIDCNLDLLKAIGISVDDADRSPRIYIGSEDENRADGWIREAGTGGSLIGFHPGCNPAAAFKRWAPDNYAKLADFLSDRYGARIVVVGGPDEREDVERLKSLMRTTCIDLVGRCTLQETAAVIKRCRFFVTNDSGIMHLATAVGVPTFAIFGPKDERHIGPYGSAHTVIRNGTDVSNVTVDQVISAIEGSPHGLADWQSS
jgi:heptosyltransferase-2